MFQSQTYSYQSVELSTDSASIKDILRMSDDKLTQYLIGSSINPLSITDSKGQCFLSLKRFNDSTIRTLSISFDINMFDVVDCDDKSIFHLYKYSNTLINFMAKRYNVNVFERLDSNDFTIFSYNKYEEQFITKHFNKHNTDLFNLLDLFGNNMFFYFTYSVEFIAHIYSEFPVNVFHIVNNNYDNMFTVRTYDYDVHRFFTDRYDFNPLTFCNRDNVNVFYNDTGSFGENNVKNEAYLMSLIKRYNTNLFDVKMGKEHTSLLLQHKFSTEFVLELLELFPTDLFKHVNLSGKTMFHLFSYDLSVVKAVLELSFVNLFKLLDKNDNNIFDITDNYDDIKLDHAEELGKQQKYFYRHSLYEVSYYSIDRCTVSLSEFEERVDVTDLCCVVCYDDYNALVDNGANIHNNICCNYSICSSCLDKLTDPTCPCCRKTLI